jgi:hypothetical protein
MPLKTFKGINSLLFTNLGINCNNCKTHDNEVRYQKNCIIKMEWTKINKNMYQHSIIKKSRNRLLISNLYTFL